jgi:hypothetical protein
MAARHDVTLKPGLILVDVPKTTFGFKSDEATYYMMGRASFPIQST